MIGSGEGINTLQCKANCNSEKRDMAAWLTTSDRNHACSSRCMSIKACSFSTKIALIIICRIPGVLLKF